MTTLVFAVLIVTAVTSIFWGNLIVALRRSRHEQQANMEEAGAATGGSITPAHLRVW
jgi:hypothetical protein